MSSTAPIVDASGRVIAPPQCREIPAEQLAELANGRRV